VIEVDGHDEPEIARLLAARATERPRALIAETVFGKGVSYMERELKWHYLPMSDTDYEQAMREIGARG
jgi:transketolase